MAMNSSNCSYTPMEYIDKKFVVIGVIGTSLSIFGILSNGLAACLLQRLMNGTSSPLFYLFILANVDILLMLEYLLMISIQIYFDYFQSFLLFEIWHSYLPVVLALSKITQTTSTYLLIVASIERFVDVGGFKDKSGFKPKKIQRLLVVGGVVSFAFLLRGIHFFSLSVKTVSECTNFGKYLLILTPITATHFFTFYSIYIENLVQVFLPCILLITLNIGILYRVKTAILRRRSVFKRQSAWQSKRREKSAKIASLMLVSILTSYLIPNFGSALICFLEYTNLDLLQTYGFVYTFSVDTINILYILSSATRILLYIRCSEKIRTEIVSIFHIVTSGKFREMPELQTVRAALLSPVFIGYSFSQ